MRDRVYLNFDESGDLGTAHDYFVIACVETSNPKSIQNKIKKMDLKTKKTFPSYSAVSEIKATDSNGIIKAYYLERLAEKDIKVSYAVAHLPTIKKELVNDENLLYNYLLHFLIVPIAKRSVGKRLVINLDNRTKKVQSANSFSDYIKIKLMYDLNLDVEIEVHYFDSQNSKLIRAADFFANAIFTKYEWEHDYFYNLFLDNVDNKVLFPRTSFTT